MGSDGPFSPGGVFLLWAGIIWRWVVISRLRDEEFS